MSRDTIFDTFDADDPPAHEPEPEPTDEELAEARKFFEENA